MLAFQKVHPISIMKTILLFGLVLLKCAQLQSQVNGPLSGNLFSNIAIGGFSQTWLAVGNAGKSDDIYATFDDIADGAGSFTDYLVATNFGFSIPDGVNVNGILVEVECSDPNMKTSDYSVRIIKAGNIGTVEKATGTAYSLEDDSISYGGAFDLWGETWDTKFIEDNRFGVAIAVQRNAVGGTTAGRIDNIKITVFYNFTTLPVTLLSFSATKGNKNVLLNWNTSSETDMTHYEAQRSSNGRNYKPIASISSNNQSQSAYYFDDLNPLSGVSFYRLKMLGRAGYQKYSSVVVVNFNNNNTLALSPCPWKKGSNLYINNPGREEFRIQFYDALGKMSANLTCYSNLVQTNNLSSQSGNLFYKILNTKDQLISTGILVVIQ